MLDCRALSPPSSRPAKTYDARPDRAHSSPSEILGAPSSEDASDVQPAADVTQHGKAQGGSVNSSGARDESGMHDNSSGTTASELSGALELSVAAVNDSKSGDVSSRMLPGPASDHSSAAGQSARSGREPGYRERESIEQEPWPPDSGSSSVRGSPHEASSVSPKVSHSFIDDL